MQAVKQPDAVAAQQNDLLVQKAKSSSQKRDSRQGNMMFLSFLVLYAALMASAFMDMIPVLQWEKQDLQYHVSWMTFLSKHYEVPLTLGALYLALTFGGEYYLRDKKGWDHELKLPLAAWSFFLGIFSVFGSLRTVPITYQIIKERGLNHLMCGDTRHEWISNNPAGIWTLIFCLSKIPELIDTVFIILRKKELITLHWYHHVSVMLFCWQAWATMSLNGLVFAAMNLTIHAVMYTFYGLTALGFRPSSFAFFITVGQIMQMVIGTAVTFYVMMDKVFWNPSKQEPMSFSVPRWIMDPKPHRDEEYECHMNSGSATFGLVMYSSYLFFFVDFFVNAYVKPNKKSKAE
jgi:elongation of very long chain fatty acids protein 6